ncbi:MAG: hypothetical protein U0V56_01665 [Actinomycetota bacterium]
MTDLERLAAFDEIRVISLPPPITAAVNRLLQEEEGWRIVDARVTERRDSGGDIGAMVVYVLGHVPSDSKEDQASQES